MIVTIAFYLFASLALVGACGVVATRNAVQAVLFLIFTFINCAGLFILLNAEFLAMMLAIVYVGAVAVLFLFVVMMLDVSASQVREKFSGYRAAMVIVGTCILAEFIFIAYVWRVSPEAKNFTTHLVDDQTTNAHALASILYTTYFFPFQICGLILLVAMVGAIVLTLRERKAVLTQDVGIQVDRDPRETVVLQRAKKGQGVIW